MTIEEVMKIAAECEACVVEMALNQHYPRAAAVNARKALRAALVALVDQARDEEAEACHAIVSEEDLRWDAMDRIRDRITARKGGKP